MKFLLFFLTVFFVFQSATAQPPGNTESIDTIKIITDTSITYIIKKPTVRIKETIEIERESRKVYAYLTMGVGAFLYLQNRRAEPGYENYTSELNKAIKPQPSYGFHATIWRAPKKLMTGFSLRVTCLRNNFNYTDTAGISLKSKVSYNYAAGGLMAGYWHRKNKKLSCIFYGAFYIDYLMSYSGPTLNEAYLIAPRMKLVTAYKSFNLNFSVNTKILLRAGDFILETEPYLAFFPITVTAKASQYKVNWYFVGLRMNFTNQLFNDKQKKSG